MSLKKIIYSIYSINALHSFLGIALAFYMKVLSVTCKLEVFGKENQLEAIEKDAPILYLLWHEQQMAFMAYAWRWLGITNSLILVEGGDRGRILCQAVDSLGATPIPVQFEGSTLSGGRNLLDLIRRMKTEDKNCIMTPDGPDGPAFELKRGVFLIAKKTGATIVPCGNFMRVGTKINRWDQYLIPFPFTKIAMTFGKPFTYTPDMDEEQIKQKISDSLHAVRLEARAKYS